MAKEWSLAHFSFLFEIDPPPQITMVEIEAIDDDQQQQHQQEEVTPASQERILDAEAIESVLEAELIAKRPSARAQLEGLAKKLRRDAAALKRMEDSRAKMEGLEVEEKIVDQSPTSASPSVAAAAAGSSTSAPPPPDPPRPIPSSVPAVAAPIAPSQHFIPIDKYAFDSGSYNSPTVSVYVSLPNVGTIPRDNITCAFTPTSFDLVVNDLNGKSYRLLNDNLANDIVPDKSKHIVKSDKIVVKLGKAKTEYGSYDHWGELTAKKDKKKKAEEKANPAAGIMDLMKQMYNEGDDNMKKMIGETMMKQREGKLGGGEDDPMAGIGGGMDF